MLLFFVTPTQRIFGTLKLFGNGTIVNSLQFHFEKYSF